MGRNGRRSRGWLFLRDGDGKGRERKRGKGSRENGGRVGTGPTYEKIVSGPLITVRNPLKK